MTSINYDADHYVVFSSTVTSSVCGPNVRSSPFLSHPLRVLAFMWQTKCYIFKTKTKRKIIFYVYWSRRNIQNWPKA